ncbi:MAG: hypothetical protein F4W68_03235, partial [Cenarchaeum sp. SB0661_bin_35]|nr:hypothetical protein [Cenarchaeum sp. SB0661_bin_35]
MVSNKPKTEHALQLSIPKDVFNRLYDRMKDDLPPSFYAGSNAKFTEENIIQFLMIMCAEGTSHEGASNLLRDKIDCAKVPTGACLLKRVGGSSYEDTYAACDKMLNHTLSEPSEYHIQVVTATDEHDVAVHFDGEI